MIRNYLALFFAATILYSLGSCKKETSEINLIPAFQGDTTTLSGLVLSDEAINAKYSVYMDFSKGVQSRAQRPSWDFAVYCGTENRLILNSSMGATAVALNKSVLTEVNGNDTIPLKDAQTLVLGASVNSIRTVDPVSGSLNTYLSGTVFPEVTADQAASKVYIVNRGTAGGVGIRQWYKMKVYQVNQSYKIDYALINEQTRVSSMTLLKDDSYNFKFASFSANQPFVEPARTQWDIEWGWNTYKDRAGTPVAVPDFVRINFAGGVRAAQIIFSGPAANSGKKYEDYTFADQTAVTYSNERDAIGVNWRNATPENGPLSVYKDRFYLVKDGEGNIYKLRFLSFAPNDGGQRGRPRLEYRLLEPAT